MSYAQNSEDLIAASYFKDFKGTLLSLGENDGITFSNAKLLIEKGWKATLVEASPGTFAKLQELHKGNQDVECINIAVSNVNGKLKFYESGTLLGGADKSLVSTLNKKELERWGDSVEFKETIVTSVNFKKLLSLSKYKKFDFITIDVEGLDFIMLAQMDLKELGCKMLIVETNGKDVIKYVNYCKQFGMNTLATNGENLIMVL